MLLKILDFFLGTSFRRTGYGKQYKLVKKGAKYIHRKYIKAPKGRTPANSSKPITSNQIDAFKKLQLRVKKIDSKNINEITFDVYQKKRRQEDRITFHIIPVSEKFESIDPRFLDRGDFHLITETINQELKSFIKKKKLDEERLQNFKKYGIRETNIQHNRRVEKENNFKETGILETNYQRKIRESKSKSK